jgi:peroxin-1
MDGHKASIKFKPLRSNLVNLPSNLCNLLFSANIVSQNVIVEIVDRAKKKSYVGWSGMPSSNLQHVEVDPVLCQSLSLRDTDMVTINLKLGNYESGNISLDPLTSSDWELIELHAQTIEDNLLSQARCVALNQVIIVYPSLTTSAKLMVTDIGTQDHSYAKISPTCEIAIAPKVRQKQPAASGGESKPKSTRPTEDYSTVPTVLKRGISLPHQLFAELPKANSNGYEVYVDFDQLPHNTFSDYAAISIVPGPDDKHKVVAPADANNSAEPAKSTPVKENKRIVAKLVNFPGAGFNTVGLSEKLSIALNVEQEIGFITVLKPAIKPSSKRPTTLTIYPYMTQTKKNSQLNLNSSTKKEQNTKLINDLSQYLNEKSPVLSSPLSNFTKIPIIPGVLPRGGILKFKKNDDHNCWLRPVNSDKRKPFKIEVGEELLRNASFIQEVQTAEKSRELAVGLDKVVDGIVDTFTASNNTGLLVHGKSGSGKTLVLNLVAEKIASEYGYYTKFVSCETIMNETFSTLSKSHVFKWLQTCSWHKPAVLILDNLDKLLPAEQEQTDSTKSNQLAEYLISQLAKIHSQHNSSLNVLFSANSKEALNKLLFQCHVIENFHYLSPPDKSTRAEILETYITQKLNSEIDFDIMDMVSETEGYLPNDLKILSDRLFHEALFTQTEEGKVVATKDHLEKCMKGYVPSNLRGVKLQKSSINWSDIGGLKEAKNVLLETLEWPTKYAPIFANCPLRLRSGILLYGYPGCGKTLLASAVAGQCGLNFISIKGPEILNKYIGASEQSVRELFERAQAAKPCILFFDEFDSIAPKRGHDSTGVTDRVVNQMLTQMDGAEGLDGVYVLAATSRPDLIDSALLRPGRLDKSVICDMPDYDDRLDILKSITAKMDLADDVRLEEIAEKTGGFSGADMQGLGYNAYLKGVHVKLAASEAKADETSKSTDDNDTYEFFQVNSEKLKNKKLRPAERVKLLQQIQNIFSKKDTESETVVETDDESQKVLITHENFVESLTETKPSISLSEKRKLQNVYRKFVSGRDGNMPDGSASNEIGGRTTLM